MTAAKKTTPAAAPDEAPTGVPGMAPHHSLVAALAAFQRELPTVPKNAVGVVPGNRNHRYADIADLNPAVLPKLAEFGLAWSCMLMTDEAGKLVLRWRLDHAPTGEHRTGDVEVNRGSNWEIGSAMTYLRRYCLEGVTGVAASHDDDGRASVEARTPAAAQPRPHAERPPTVAEVRANLGAQARDEQWNLDNVAARYREEHGEDLWDATDPAKVEKFRQSLSGVPVLELQAAPDEQLPLDEAAS